MYSIKTLLAHARHNFKIIAGYNLVAAAGLLVLIPLLFSFRYIDYKGMAYVGEYFLSISGILLITHIGNIEEGYGIEDVVYSKVTPHVFTFITRLVISFWLTFAAVGIVAVAARMSGGMFPVWKIWAGVFITSLFLGIVGMTVATIVKNLVSGYLAAFGYFLFELFTGGKYTGEFYLLSLLKDSFVAKYRILLLTAILLIFNIWISCRKD